MAVDGMMSIRAEITSPPARLFSTTTRFPSNVVAISAMLQYTALLFFVGRANNTNAAIIARNAKYAIPYRLHTLNFEKSNENIFPADVKKMKTVQMKNRIAQKLYCERFLIKVPSSSKLTHGSLKSALLPVNPQIVPSSGEYACFLHELQYLTLSVCFIWCSYYRLDIQQS